MPNYRNSKIFKIVNDNTDNVYFGSTTQPLCKSFYSHKKKQDYKIIFEGINPKIILVENFECNNVEELRKRLRYYVDNNRCINLNLPNRNDKQYHSDNRDKYIEYNKKYREINKEKLKDYREKNKERRNQQKKEYYQKNKEIILEKIKNKNKQKN